MTASVSATGGSALARFRRGWGRLGRALEHPAVMPGIAVAGAVFVVAMVSFAMRGDPLIGYDAHAYYQAAALDDPYRATINGGFDAVGGLYEYKYPPPLAQVLHPVRMLGISWPAFLGAWTALLLVSLAFMGRRWTLLLLLFPPVLGELWLGNLNILLGLAIVLGMRWPASWAFILLTKITPGIGLIWFAARREWRNLAIALVATVVVVGVSYVAGAVAVGRLHRGVEDAGRRDGERATPGGARRAAAAARRGGRARRSGPPGRTARGSCRSPPGSPCRSCGGTRSPSWSRRCRCTRGGPPRAGPPRRPAPRCRSLPRPADRTT